MANSFDGLPKDLKLYLFGFLNTKDAMAVTAVNRVNRSLREYPPFWWQRSIMDFNQKVPQGEVARDFYLNMHRKRLEKIRRTYGGTIMIDAKGELQIVADSVELTDDGAMEYLQKLRAFSEKHRIVDVRWSVSGSTYIVTEDGVYGYGNNIHNQLGINTGGNRVDEIVRIFTPDPDDEIVNIHAGMDYTAVQTKKKIWLAGELDEQPVTLDIANDIVRVVSGYYKIVLQKSDHSLLVIGRDNRGLLQKEIQHTKPLSITHYQLKEFQHKKIMDLFACGENLLVRCEDGLYFHGDENYLSPGQQVKGSSFRLMGFFADKEIRQVCLSACHMIVHCADGVYAAGLNSIGELGTGDHESKREFTKIEIDPANIINIELAGSSFIRRHDSWYMAGSFGRAVEERRHILNFTPIEFVPLADVVPAPHLNQRCVIL